jgi:AraC-like DNA-binding protein
MHKICLGSFKYLSPGQVCIGKGLNVMANLGKHLKLTDHPDKARIEDLIVEMESWPDSITMIHEFSLQRTHAGSQAKDMLGYDKWLWDSDFISTITHPDDIYSINEKMASYLLEANKPFYDREAPAIMKLLGRLRHNNGKYIPIEFSGVILQYDARGGFQLGVGAYQNISRREEDLLSRRKHEEMRQKIEGHLLEIKRLYHRIYPCKTTSSLSLPAEEHDQASKIHIVNIEQLALKVKHGVEVQRLLRNYSSLKGTTASTDLQHQPAINDVSFVNKVIEAIERHLNDPTLTTTTLAQELTVSRANLHRKIKIASGIPPAELIKKVRLDKAARLLSEPEKSVAEVAYMVGFDDSSYFSKCFRRHYGLTPSEYKRKGTSA